MSYFGKRLKSAAIGQTLDHRTKRANRRIMLQRKRKLINHAMRLASQ